MSTSDLVSLFDEPWSSRRGVSPFFVSSAAHAVALLLLSYGLLHGAQIEDPIVTERYSVRHLELRTPTPPPDQVQTAPETSGPESSSLALPSDARDTLHFQLPAGTSGPQTLVQPSFHLHTNLAQNALVPTVMIWTPELASTRKIVPPLPDKPSAAATKPSLDAPNEELALGDLSVASSKAADRELAIPAGTASPLSAREPELLQMAPVTTSVSTVPPTPTAVLSVSDVRMREGTIILPPVNELHAPPASRAPSLGQPSAAASAKTPLSSGKSRVPDANNARTTATVSTPAPTAVEQDVDAVTHIALSPNGRFGVVVVGDSIADEYPEMLPIWGDRLAYTAYLHVGLSKNWILEYTQTRAVDLNHAGTVARLEAPWPYDILRPNLVSRDLNADALMVHGIVDEAGHFESLAVAFPTQYAHSAFVLHTLQQWQFRPARQNGKPVSVEVLLIIPEEAD